MIKTEGPAVGIESAELNSSPLTQLLSVGVTFSVIFHIFFRSLMLALMPYLL